MAEIICFDRAQLDAARLAQAKGDANGSSAHRNRMSTAEQEEEKVEQEEEKVDNIVQATFTNAEDGIRAVESLLHHGVRAEDINLIRPEPHRTGTTQTVVAPEAVESEKAPAAPIGYCHEAAVDLKEGAGLGLLFGLLATLCVPDLDLIAGPGAIVAGLMAASTAAGGIVGGIYGYLIDRGIDHEVARKVSDCVAAGEMTLSITLTGELKKGEIVRILKAFGGHFIRQPGYYYPLVPSRLPGSVEPPEN